MSSTCYYQHTGIRHKCLAISQLGSTHVILKLSLMFSLWKFTTTGSTGWAEQVDKNATRVPRTDTLYTLTKADNGCVKMIPLICCGQTTLSLLCQISEQKTQMGLIFVIEKVQTKLCICFNGLETVTSLLYMGMLNDWNWISTLAHQSFLFSLFLFRAVN